MNDVIAGILNRNGLLTGYGNPSGQSRSIRLDWDEDRWCKLAVPNAKRER